MTSPDPPLHQIDLAALAGDRVRRQIADAAARRNRRKATRLRLAAARTVGLATRHQDRLDHLTNTTTAPSAT
ncbi:hypothetical protein GCM10023235_50390 [Kitasatospora terrestris]|uniref:Uncharacterized protein n=1 Tax=Kitasatospora terrestris TaxID=258051 RepID=A0ABP9E4Q5_9ACTN